VADWFLCCTSRSTLAKKWSLLRTIGPPMVPPHSCLLVSGFSALLTLVK
jgi:hypothetical protein